jgi:hypothetical protein
MDLVADELMDGREFRTLVPDLYSRQCLDNTVGRSLTSQDVAATLEREANTVVVIPEGGIFGAPLKK